MNYKELTEIERLFKKIPRHLGSVVKFMEVCGTHTMAISQLGLHSIIPDGLRLISGPGCPVCVTSCEQIDLMIAVSRVRENIVVTFGDMMRVPGSKSSLEKEKANGADIRIVYSPVDSLKIALENPHKNIVFLGIGFETTIPTIAATILRASKLNIDNFYVLPAFKMIPPAMKTIMEDEEVSINGFICPGHVSVVIGKKDYEKLAKEKDVPCVITGFEAKDILKGIKMLLKQIVEGRSEVENAYKRAVSPHGNPVALNLIERVFSKCDTNWRGLGKIPNSGLEFSEEFAKYDIRIRFPVHVEQVSDLHSGCACGDVLRGLINPAECPLFGNVCQPGQPVGPCMVSSEGACAAYYKYGKRFGK